MFDTSQFKIVTVLGSKPLVKPGMPSSRINLTRPLSTLIYLCRASGGLRGSVVILTSRMSQERLSECRLRQTSIIGYDLPAGFPAIPPRPPARPAAMRS